MELCTYHLFTIHLLLCLSAVTPPAAKGTASKTDISALLSFKSQISGDPFGVLSSWNESFHYCQWQGVLCGRHHSDRVTALILDSKQLTGIGYLNRLRFLNLSMNFLDGSIPTVIGNCTNLEVIELLYNKLHGTISPTLAQCQKLQIIHLGNNYLTGGIPLEFGYIPQLRILGLHVNNLTGTIPSTLGNLSSLMYLYLHQNNFDGHIPDSLGNLTNLLYLWLYENNLSGYISPTLGNLSKLQYFSLETNNFHGPIPFTLGNLTSLIQLSLSQNRLSGTIPQSLYNISTIVLLGLYDNKLEGTLPFEMCGAFSNLQYLDLSKNQFKGQIPSSISNCSALTNIAMFDNYFSGIIPPSIGFLENLNLLNIGSNKLEAKKPQDWLFLDTLANCKSLQILVLDYNKLQGVLPSSLANLSTSLHYLVLSGNPISGSIPTNFGNLFNLDLLLLDHMLLNDTIPEEIQSLFKLELLDLSNNMISGQIPSVVGNLTKMVHLNLDSNALEGSIPVELGNLRALEFLNLSNNKLIGKVPKEIMTLPISLGLDLSYNYLTGFLPPEIGKLKNVQAIWFSHNKLSGEIPGTIDGCQILQYLYLDSNMFHGTIPSSLSNLKGLQELDVSNNSFSGQIPEFMGKMNLLYLNISYNNFEGVLPKDGIFQNVSAIDVRGNPKLCGGVLELHLTQCISKLPEKRHHSQGKRVVIIFVASSFICLIIGLCMLATYYYKKSPQSNPQSNRALNFELRHVSYHNLLKATENFSSQNLIGKGTFGSVYKAVMIFENVTIVAVKVLNLETHGASRSFFSECEALRNVRHRNLIKVLSSCSSIDQHGNDFKALVFEFMPNGNLASWLHPNTNAYIDRPVRSLNLIQRLSIAVDVAMALEYLHYHGPSPIVHCDLKPSNVLLDDNMTAHVGDFGLARFLESPDALLSQSLKSTGGIKGSIGYIPPEYGMGGRPSVEGDVYSYGILLLEIFTGVSPTDERLKDGVSLHKHVEMAFPEQVMGIVDTKLFSAADVEANTYASENVFDCMLIVIQCGLLCSKELPKERITIKDVVKQLNTILKKLLTP
ncbi:Leucine-rich receptor-like protein kinase family protein [Rhynchospora pubera]|uniref:Receptor kinase-like protein Xa21 n=1 Tax=Rhynchospora pubera TaxID=906938 RepID=A0AAV8GUW3_9POAL|nr:Leucine-rich receptor-like protein kinase family protein [Rhynchospora pubera]